MSDAANWVREQLGPSLLPGEEILHVGYLTNPMTGGALSGITTNAYWVALTTGRLHVIHAPVGAFYPLLENKGVDTYQRPDIMGIVRRGGQLIVMLVGGRRLVFGAKAKVTLLPEQTAFLEGLVTLHRAPPELVAAIEKRVRKRLILVLVLTAASSAASSAFVIYKYAYADRVEAHVACHESSSGVVCDVERVSGGQEASACWDVVISCANGNRLTGQGCVNVPKSGAQTMTMSESYFPRFWTCDKALRIEVANLKLQRQ